MSDTPPLPVVEDDPEATMVLGVLIHAARFLAAQKAARLQAMYYGLHDYWEAIPDNRESRVLVRVLDGLERITGETAHEEE